MEVMGGGMGGPVEASAGDNSESPRLVPFSCVPPAPENASSSLWLSPEPSGLEPGPSPTWPS